MGRPRLRCSGRSMSRWPTHFALVLVALLSLGTLRAAEAQAPPAPAVGVRAAEIRGVARSYEFIGRIGAINTVQLRARVEGFLDKILFTEGQEVKEGDLLYQIEKAPYQAQVNQAKGKLVSDQAQVVNAELQYRRSFELAQHQNAPQSQADKDKATLDSARAAVNNNLREEDQLDVKRYPTISFESTRVAKVAEGKLSVTGVMEIRGVKKEYALGVSVVTVERDWRLARAWLVDQLGGGDG